MRTIILDCDIASCIAKVDKVDLLKRAFLDSDIYITNSVYIELLRAKQAGFSFPDRIFESIPVISLNQDEIETLQELSLKRWIHFGESEGISIAKNRGAIFLTNDSKVVHYCKEIGIEVLDLKDILLLLAIRKMITHAEMKDLIQDIEEKDNTLIKDKASILNRL
jgi:predicted nucleic acid-binding protein